MLDARLQILTVQSAEQTVQMSKIAEQLNVANRAQAIIETLVSTQGRRIEALETELRSLKGR